MNTEPSKGQYEVMRQYGQASCCSDELQTCLEPTNVYCVHPNFDLVLIAIGVQFLSFSYFWARKIMVMYGIITVIL